MSEAYTEWRDFEGKTWVDHLEEKVGKLLTPRDIAQRLQVQELTVTEWLRTKQLSGVKLGRLWRVTEAQLAMFLESRSHRE